MLAIDSLKELNGIFKRFKSYKIVSTDIDSINYEIRCFIGNEFFLVAVKAYPPVNGMFLMSTLLEIGTSIRHQLSGRLEYIAPLGQRTDGVTRFEIHAMLPTANLNGHMIRAGSSATAQIVTSKKTEVLSVEEKDLIFDGDSVFVELLMGDYVKKRAVKLGLSDGLIVEVTKGLSMKDRIKVKTENSQK